MGRKKRKAIDPFNTDKKQIADFRLRGVPKRVNLEPKEDDSDVESTVRRGGGSNNMGRTADALSTSDPHAKAARRAANKVLKKRRAAEARMDDPEEDNPFSRPISKRPSTNSSNVMKSKATPISAKMPTINDGESYSSFSRRLKKARYQQLTQLSQTQRAEEAMGTPGLSNISAKRKVKLQERKEHQRDKQHRSRSRSNSPVRDLPQADYNSGSAANEASSHIIKKQRSRGDRVKPSVNSSDDDSDADANIKGGKNRTGKRHFDSVSRPAFGDVVLAPPKLTVVPKVKKSMSVTEWQRNVEQQQEELHELKSIVVAHIVELTEEEERDVFRARMAKIHTDTDRQRAIISYKRSKLMKNKAHRAEMKENIERTGVHSSTTRGSDQSYGNL